MQAVFRPFEIEAFEAQMDSDQDSNQLNIDQAETGSNSSDSGVNSGSDEAKFNDSGKDSIGDSDEDVVEVINVDNEQKLLNAISAFWRPPVAELENTDTTQAHRKPSIQHSNHSGCSSKCCSGHSDNDSHHHHHHHHAPSSPEAPFSIQKQLQTSMIQHTTDQLRHNLFSPVINQKLDLSYQVARFNEGMKLQMAQNQSFGSTMSCSVCHKGHNSIIELEVENRKIKFFKNSL